MAKEEQSDEKKQAHWKDSGYDRQNMPRVVS